MADNPDAFMMSDKPAGSPVGDRPVPLQHGVYMWLGVHRDKLPPRAVEELQNILGPLAAVPPVPAVDPTREALASARDDRLPRVELTPEQCAQLDAAEAARAASPSPASGDAAPSECKCVERIREAMKHETNRVRYYAMDHAAKVASGLHPVDPAKRRASHPAAPPVPAVDREHADCATLEDVKREVFCRVFPDFDKAHEEWAAWYKPGKWFWWGRALGAFIHNRLASAPPPAGEGT